MEVLEPTALAATYTIRQNSFWLGDGEKIPGLKIYKHSRMSNQIVGHNCGLISKFPDLHSFGPRNVPLQHSSSCLHSRSTCPQRDFRHSQGRRCPYGSRDQTMGIAS